MTKVWEHEFPANQQLVMLALADHANDEGSQIFPSIERIAWKTGYSTRSIQRVIRDLQEAGILCVVRKANRYRPTEYSIDWSKAIQKAPYIQGCQDVTPAGRGDMDDVSGVTSEVSRGDTGVVSGVTQLCHPNRHINHQREPSLEPSEERAAPVPDFSNPRLLPENLKLPEIARYKQVTGRTPVMPQMPIIWQTIRDHAFTTEDLLPFWQAWIERGYNPANLAWLTEWAVSGAIPDHRQKSKSPPLSPDPSAFDPAGYTEGEFAQFLEY
jgi:hypothetical protein